MRRGQQADTQAPVTGGDEKRNAPRIPASQLPSIAGLRISPHGADAALVNISTSGLLAECAVRLKTGATVTIQIEGTFSPNTVQGRVARCSVARVDNGGTLRYHVGIAFAAPIALPVDAERPAPVAEAAAPEPAAPVAAPAAPPEPPRPVVRNRW